MGKDWDYSKLAHNAKLNGGPESYLDLIRENSMREGKLEGKAEGKTEVLIAESIAFGVALLGYAGYKAYTTIKDRHEREAIKKQEKEVRKAEVELIDGINKAIEEENNIIDVASEIDGNEE